MPLTTEIVLGALVGIAAWTDLRTRHIPNAITLAGAVFGFALQAWYGGLQGAVTSLEGAALGVAFLIVFFIAGGMGAGDVKLFGAVGALVGPQALVLVFVFTGLAGGVAATAVAIRRRHLKGTLPYGAVIAAGTFVFLIASRV